MANGSFTAVNGGGTVFAAFAQYLAIALTANQTLNWPTDFQNVNGVVAVWMDVTPSAGGFVLKLPDATQAAPGVLFYIRNTSGADTFSLHDGADGNLLTLPVGTVYVVGLTDNTTVAGAWAVFPFTAGAGAITSLNAVVLDDIPQANLEITANPGLPLTGPGTLEFTFPAGSDLLNLLTAANNMTNFPAKTDAGTNTWAFRAFQQTAGQVLIGNPGGVAGDPVFSLDPNLGNLGAGNLLVSGLFGSILIAGDPGANTISATGGPINLTAAAGNPVTVTDATGLVVNKVKFALNPGTNGTAFLSPGGMGFDIEYTWPTALPTAGQVLSSGAPVVGPPYTAQLTWVTTPTIAGAAIVNAVPKFSTTGGNLVSTGISVDATNNILQAPQLVVGTNIQVGVIANTINTLGGDLILQPAGNLVMNRPVQITSGNSLSFYNAGNTNFSGLVAAPNPTNTTWVLPRADAPLMNALMQTSGTGAGSILSFTTMSSQNIPWASAVVTLGTGVILTSTNVTSVVSLGTGAYTVTFDSGFTNTSFGCIGSLQVTGGGAGSGFIGYVPVTATTCTVSTYAGTSGLLSNLTGTMTLAFYGAHD